MKAPRFEYAAPVTTGEAVELLAREEDARPLAGGQSLVPLLNLRFARPSIVVDLNRIEELRALEWVNGHLRIGATVRQRTLETDARVRERLPLLTEAAAHIAHVAIRTRGTVGGSVAHADPAAELPAALTVLGARMVVRGGEGERTVPVAEFFRGPFTTAVEAGELLAAVEVDVPPAGTGSAFLEVARVHGAFALAGVAALLRVEGGRIAKLALAALGVGPVPYVPAWLDEVALDERPTESLWAEVAARVRAELEPSGDGQAGPEYRRRVTETLVRRALGLVEERAR